MAKMISCRDMGVDCDFVARGETADEVMQSCAVHAREAHGIADISPEMAAQVAGVMKEA